MNSATSTPPLGGLTRGVVHHRPARHILWPFGDTPPGGAMTQRDAVRMYPMAVMVLLMGPGLWVQRQLHPAWWVLPIYALEALAILGLIRVADSRRIEWDGTRLLRRGLGRRQVLGHSGRGQIVHARVSDPLTGGTGIWFLDADGQRIARLPGSGYDRAELQALAAQVQIPFDDLGTVTQQELADRYPVLVPRLFGAQGEQRDLTGIAVPDAVALLTIVGTLVAIVLFVRWTNSA